MPLPQPSLGVTGDPKSSSLNAAPEQTKSSWLTNVRPVFESVKPIGSSETWFDGAATSSLTSVHDDACCFAWKSTRYSLVYAGNSVRPVFQLLPIEGSPALSALPFGASNWR